MPPCAPVCVRHSVRKPSDNLRADNRSMRRSRVRFRCEGNRVNNFSSKDSSYHLCELLTKPSETSIIAVQGFTESVENRPLSDIFFQKRTHAPTRDPPHKTKQSLTCSPSQNSAFCATRNLWPSNRFPKPAPDWQSATRTGRARVTKAARVQSSARQSTNGRMKWNGELGCPAPRSRTRRRNARLPIRLELAETGKHPRSNPFRSTACRCGSAIAEGQTLDETPLEQEIVRWYQAPCGIHDPGLEDHAEFGSTAVSGGQPETLAIQTGLEMRRKTDAYHARKNWISITANEPAREHRPPRTNRSDSTSIRPLARRFELDDVRGKFGPEFDEFKASIAGQSQRRFLGYYWIRTTLHLNHLRLRCCAVRVESGSH